MARFKKRRDEGTDVPEATAEITSRVAAYPTAPEAEPDEAAPAAEPDADVEPSSDGDFARVGEHVATVLKAAEDAAARVVDEAEARASELRASADREASARLEEAETTAARLRLEAERAHSEAVVTAGEMRAAAEADAARIRTEAEEEAARVRAAAEHDAATFGERAAAQHEDLLNDMALAEDRLHRLVDGLHEVADHLDGLLEDDEDEPADEPSSLVEALKPDGSARAAGE